MPDKNTSIQDYNSSFTKKVENALIDIWALLGEYRDDLILIGGLAPRYITAPAKPRPDCNRIGKACSVRYLTY